MNEIKEGNQLVQALTERIFSLWSTQYFGETSAGAAMMIDTNGSISITRLYKFGTFNEGTAPPSPPLPFNLFPFEISLVPV